MLFILISCESSRNFSVFSSQEASKKEIRQEEVLKSPKDDASVKEDSNVTIRKKKKTKLTLNFMKLKMKEYDELKKK